MKTLLLGLALLLVTRPAAAQWSTADKAFAAVGAAALTYDWLQTLEIAHRPDLWRETNPLMPRQPSVGRVNAMLAVAALANVAATKWLPRVPRKIWLRAVTAGELHAVLHGIAVGCRLGTPW